MLWACATWLGAPTPAQAQGNVPTVTMQHVEEISYGPTEGLTDPLWRLVRTGGDHAQPLVVRVRITETGSAPTTTAPYETTVTLPTGAGETEFEQATTGDRKPEPHSMVTATVIAGSGYQVGSPSSDTVTVRDDYVGEVSVSTLARVSESAGAATTEIRLSKYMGRTSHEPWSIFLDVDAAPHESPATAGEDFERLANIVTFQSQAHQKTVSWDIYDDEIAEGDEHVRVRLFSNNTAHPLDEDASEVIVTIEDDDFAPVLNRRAFAVSGRDLRVDRLTAWDGDHPSSELTWALIGGADESHFTLTSTGVLSFTTTKDPEGPDYANADGAYELLVRVTDGHNLVETPVKVHLAGPAPMLWFEQDGEPLPSFVVSGEESATFDVVIDFGEPVVGFTQSDLKVTRMSAKPAIIGWRQNAQQSRFTATVRVEEEGGITFRTGLGAAHDAGGRPIDRGERRI